MRAKVHLDRDIRFATVEVNLSESDLVMMLRKFERRGTGRSVFDGDVVEPWSGNLVIRVQTDSDHYVGNYGSSLKAQIDIVQSEDFNEEDNPCGC